MGGRGQSRDELSPLIIERFLSSLQSSGCKPKTREVSDVLCLCDWNPFWQEEELRDYFRDLVDFVRNRAGEAAQGKKGWMDT